MEIKVHLRCFKKILIFKASKLKKSLNFSALKKYILAMHPVVKLCIGIAVLSAVASLAYAGI